MVWARGKDGRGELTKKGQNSCRGRSTGRGRPRFGWLDGMKRALAIREEGLQKATQLSKERNVWRELMRA